MAHLCRQFSAKEPYKRDDILQKRPICLRILLTIATPHQNPMRWLNFAVNFLQESPTISGYFAGNTLKDIPHHPLYLQGSEAP